MKTTLSVQRVALLALALATASVTATFADDSTTPTTPPTCSAGCHHHGSVLTDAEKTELKTAHDTALANNPGLKQQFEALKGNTSATKADWKALKTQLRADELAVDANLAPIFAKLDAAHHHHHSD